MTPNPKRPINKSEQPGSLEIKYYLYKVFSYWRLFSVTILVSLIASAFLNGYRTKLYSSKTIISVKEETNPLFSTGTSLTFNWGGASDLIETITIILKSRTHNEKVISNLQFYVEYLRDGKYRLGDVYGKTPFKIKLNENSYQLFNQLLKIETLEKNQFRLSTTFSTENPSILTRYSDNTSTTYEIPDKEYSKIFFFNPSDATEFNVKTPFLDINVFSSELFVQPDQTYFIRLKDYNATVEAYQKVVVKNIIEGASILELSMTGENRSRIVDYLNESVQVLSRDKQEQKTLYATKTVKYIDDLFKKEADQLRQIQEEIGDFKKSNNIYNLSSEGDELFLQTSSLSLELKKTEKNVEELDILEEYIRSSTIYDKLVPVPAFIQLADIKTSSMIDELILESTKLEFLKDKVKAIHPDYQKLSSKVEQIKLNLLENLSNNRTSLNREISRIEEALSFYEKKLNLLPEKEQRLLKYQKEYEFSEFYYSYFKQKKYEASAAVEASVSDIKVIDTAVDLGKPPIYPKPLFNYLVGVMLGITLPLLYIIIRELLDTKIRSIDEVESSHSIPILGAVSRNYGDNNLVVFERPTSVVAESFRALRSNIQFLFKNTSNDKTAKTLLVTSSIGGEGKTMISVNMATVFALSGKKTVLIGMDLRKPKIFDDFQLDNDIGIVNYLIGQKSPSEITKKSKVPNLDVILSGPIPPNPSELIISDPCDQIIHQLKENYEYLVIDTPPVGLVSDALELFKYSDAICYVIRQGYTQRGMMDMIDNKYLNKEVTNISYIINDYNLTSNYGYRYGYRSGYGHGYHEKDRPKNLLSRVLNFIRVKK